MGDHNIHVNDLPPGFRFYPSDEELVIHFLQRRASLLPCDPDIIPDLDLYPYDPWDLHGKAMVEGNKWYFYSRRTQKRITESGYWEEMDGDESIYNTSGTKLVGFKKHYMFFIGDQSANNIIKTNWIMHEFRLSGSASTTKSSKRRAHSKDCSRWVICRVYEENNTDEDEPALSCLDEVFLSLEDDLDEISFPN